MNKIIVCLCILSGFSGLAFADDSAHQASIKGGSLKKGATMTLEQRQGMASAHEKMAVCLRSQKPLRECREEMMSTCKDTLGKEGCPMMGMKGMRKHHE